jgi:hypothetical protein
LRDFDLALLVPIDNDDVVIVNEIDDGDDDDGGGDDDDDGGGGDDDDDDDDGYRFCKGGISLPIKRYIAILLLLSNILVSSLRN